MRFSHPDVTGVTAFRIYLRAEGQPFGAPAFEGIPPVSNGVYVAEVEVPDGETRLASGTAINESGESTFSNEIVLSPPPPPDPVCGDGRLDPGEQCDDGNTASGDGCDALCRIEPPPPACGDGRLDPGEQCDDGNTASGDGCDALCRIEPPPPACGDGRLDPGEQCDDGNTASGDGCDALCRIEVAEEQPFVPYFVNVGGADYADPTSQLWLNDGEFTDAGTPATFSVSIRGTQLDPMYQSRRYGPTDGAPVTFELPVGAPDLYTVRLHFAEVGLEVTRPGQRIFDILVDDALWIRDLDVYAEVGSRRPLQRSLTVYAAQGRFSVRLIPKQGRPMLSGIEIWRASDATVEGAPSAPRIVGCGQRCR